MLPRSLPQILLAGLLVAGAFALGRMTRRVEPAAISARDASPALPPGAPATQANEAPASASSVSPAASSRGRQVAAAMQAVLRGADRATRLYDFAVRLREMAPEQLPALFQSLRKTRLAETPELLAMLCSVWAAQDGPAAFAGGRSVATIDGEHAALHAAITGWARRDPMAAQAALRETGLTDLSTDEMAAFVQGWASGNPAAAEAFLRQAGATAAAGGAEEVPAAVQRGFEEVARARIASDPAAALEWYGGLRESLKERLRQTMASQLAIADPQAASRWLAADASAQLGAGDLVSMLRGLQLESFDQQFAWAKNAANPVTRESALAAVVGESAATNLVPLGEWLAERADDRSLMPAFSAYALQVVRKSPNAAITWAMSLDPGDLRQTTLNTVVAEWISINPRLAREWATRTGLVDYEALVR